MKKQSQGGFVDIIVILIAGAVILGAGLVLDGIKTVTQDELPDGWSYDQTIMEAE
jgi:hypothetical protein